MPMYTSWHLPFGFWTKIFYAFLSSTRLAKCPKNLVLIYPIPPTIINEQYKLRTVSLCSFLRRQQNYRHENNRMTNFGVRLLHPHSIVNGECRMKQEVKQEFGKKRPSYIRCTIPKCAGTEWRKPQKFSVTPTGVHAQYSKQALF